MRTNPLMKAGGSFVQSGYRACEWAQLARLRSHIAAAEAWEQADREGWDAEHFSEERRAELARKNPKAFINGAMVVPEMAR